MENSDETYTEPAEHGTRGRTPLIATCAVLIVLSCCCLLGAGLVIYLDPLDWNLIARLTGRYDAAAEAVPADAMLYVGLDLLQLQSPEAERIFKAFADAVPEGEFGGSEDVFNDLDEEMEQEFGFTFTGDIQPWVGRHAGIGITDLQISPSGEFESIDFIFAAAIRDRAAAEAFSAVLQDRIEAESGGTIQSSEYEGTTIYALPGDPGEGIAFAIHRGTFLFSTGAAAIRESIDAKSGDSFMDTEIFRNLAGQLPGDGLLHVFATPTLMEGVAESFSPGLVSTSAFGGQIPFLGSAFSFAFVPAGIRIDTATMYDPEAVPEFLQQVNDLRLQELTIDGRIPGNTLIFAGGRGLAFTIELIRERMAADGSDASVDESMAAFESEFGFSLENDLLANLDGEYALVVLPSRDGMLAAREVSLGVVLLFETSNPDGLAPVLAALEEILARELVAPEQLEVNGAVVYQVGDPFLGEMFSYGVVENRFLVATSASLIRDLQADGPSLRVSETYQAVWGDFPNGTTPSFYFDVAGLIGSIREGMSSGDRADFDANLAGALGPFRQIAMGTRSPSPELQLTTLIVFIDGGTD
jgi:hypothetical protein